MAHDLEDNENSNWRVVHFQAGYYQINIGSTYEDDNLEKLMKEALKKLLEIKKHIPIDKPMMSNEIC